MTQTLPRDLRERERESIRGFIERAGADGYLVGRVLDYGCGKQPYRSLVESFGCEYVGYDHAEFPGNVSGQDVNAYTVPELPQATFNVVLCTQVLQYSDDPALTLGAIGSHLRADAVLVLTYPTHWPEVETEDLWRFTRAGMERLLRETGFGIVRHEPRHVAAVTLSGEELVAGYGCIARA